MRQPNRHDPWLLTLLLSVLLFTRVTTAQIGTITQDITAIAAYGLQKPCAQSCFQTTGFCPNDILGSKIGCREHTDCYDANWQATNDCYCRSDLQKAAQDYLTSCVKRSCTAGDARIDGSTAGGIYVQYCKEKGYKLAAGPATVPASATGTATSAGGNNGPTETSTTSPSNQQGSPSPSGSKKLPTSTIIGIAVGGLVGLVILWAVLSSVLKWFGCTGGGRKPLPQQQHPLPFHEQASYPMNLYPEQPYWQQKPVGAESEVGPDDSVSVVTAPRFAPTMVSNVRR
jgi:hypothetical protein